MNSAPPLDPSSGRSRLEVQRLHVAVIAFPDVEEIEFAGPFGMFAAVNDISEAPGLHVFTLAETPSSIRARHGLRIVPDFTFERCPRPDVLVVPGGPGTRLLVDKPSMLEWVRTRSHTAMATLSVGTGARVLAKAGLLDEFTVTTDAGHPDEPRGFAPAPSTGSAKRFRDEPHPTGTGRLVASAGATAGLDGTFHVIQILFGPDVAARASQHVGYLRSSGGGEC